MSKRTTTQPRWLSTAGGWRGSDGPFESDLKDEIADYASRTMFANAAHSYSFAGRTLETSCFMVRCRPGCWRLSPLSLAAKVRASRRRAGLAPIDIQEMASRAEGQRS